MHAVGTFIGASARTVGVACKNTGFQIFEIAKAAIVVYPILRVFPVQTFHFVPFNEKQTIYEAALEMPIYEEIFNRGIIHNAVRIPQWAYVKWIVKRPLTPQEKEREKTIRIAISSLIFGLMHLPNSPTLLGKIEYVWQTSFLGGICAYEMERTGSLFTPILIHSLNNAVYAYMEEKHPHLSKCLDLIIDIVYLYAFYRLFFAKSQQTTPN